MRPITEQERLAGGSEVAFPVDKQVCFIIVHVHVYIGIWCYGISFTTTDG